MKKHPLPGIYLRGSVLALAVLAGSCAARKQAANQSLTLKTTTTPGGTVATATTGTPKRKGLKSLATLFPLKQKLIAAFLILIKLMANITTKYPIH